MARKISNLLSKLQSALILAFNGEKWGEVKFDLTTEYHHKKDELNTLTLRSTQQMNIRDSTRRRTTLINLFAETKAGIKKATAVPRLTYVEDDKRDVTKEHLALTIENGILPAALPECGKQEFKLTTVAATSNTEFVNQGYIFKWTHFAGTIDTDPTADLEITDGGRFTVQAFKDAEGAKSISSVVAALVLVLALRRGAKEVSSALLQPFNRWEQLICGSVCRHKAHKRFDSDMSIRRRNGQSGECPSSAFSDNPICQDEWGLPIKPCEWNSSPSCKRTSPLLPSKLLVSRAPNDDKTISKPRNWLVAPDIVKAIPFE
ncbi:hypothetical protein BLNAU_10126 [Blattamonas nauphoetae]|uniref:Uncharacterized protein n=1 Tax=Blattamonas nauphoetae TaxID=2049346 RepID=A0ABQ9XU22_9EUKA|nr:hypothetical protein BLNAU_10126 [Blattamonas nauphoetae]